MVLRLNPDNEKALTLPEGFGVDIDNFKLLIKDLTDAIIESIFHKGAYQSCRTRIQTLQKFLDITDVQKRYQINPNKPEHILLLGYALFDADETAREAMSAVVRQNRAVIFDVSKK